MYSYLTGDDHVDKKAKATKDCVIKQEIAFTDYKTCLENKTILRTQQGFSSEAHTMYYEKK